MNLWLERLQQKFPGAVPFILIICYLERYAAISITGREINPYKVNILMLDIKNITHCTLTAILVLYLNRQLHIDPSSSTAILHANDFLVYFFTIVGAIIGDSYWGAFKTITWMLLVYSAGTGIVAVGAIDSINISAL